ncbi:protein of unknown function UPF0182 [Gemmatirosa kalamazoonensis]|uniref:Uncharacterized protein n=1 Tax=Gemmatirosa kalamazoonensis TaxID=861299 RepID=W0RK58_9BACT|nr:UPF0182 family protein [Gemmatirosa kalamazoonensis]AHG90817.1 protein of unknown function UPF0182 [Gemmatirosa kalamazoonensis]
MNARRLLALAALVAAILFGGRLVASVYVDYRWFAALGDGPLSVWRARVTDLAALRLVLTLAGSAFLFANLYGVSTSVESLEMPRRLGDLEIREKVPGRQLLWFAGAVALVAGLGLSLFVDDWMAFDMVQFGRAFGVPEPYTGADLAFFVHWLPFENALYLWGVWLLLAAAAIVVLLYALTADLRWDAGRLRTTRHVRRHLTVLAACLLLVLAWGHRLDAYALLSAGSGQNDAFVYVDHRIAMRSRFVLAALTAIGALLVLHAAWQGQGRLTLWVITAVLGLTVVLRGIVPVVGARLVGGAEIARRDVPYLRNRAVVTQTAYGVNRIQRATGYGLASADSAGLAIPLWDPAVLARGIERARRGEMVSDDIGWQPIGGHLAAVAVTRPAAPPDGEPLSWDVALASASLADAAGDPILLDSLGRATPNGVLGEGSGRERRLVVRPQATGHLIINDTTGRVLADPIASFGARLAHAWDERDFRLLFTDALDRLESPVIVRHRDVRERLTEIAPFFSQGHALTPAFARDTVYWLCHLYAASPSFPLSQRYAVGRAAWSYFQHAAIAVVNGESGAVTIVADPSPDRLTETWVRRFPLLFSAPSALPPSLVAALPPPTDGVLLQASAMSQYGTRGDMIPTPVHLPGGDGVDSTLGLAPRALALLPTTTAGERALGWTLPLLDAGDRVSGVLVALGGPSPATLWVPNGRAGPRWGEVVERLRAVGPPTADASEGAGRDVARARIRALPIGDGLAYVQPLYVVHGGGQAAAAGVAALVRDTARAAPSIGEALGGDAPRAAIAPTTPRAAAATSAERVRTLYDAMRAALRRGDWAAFGAAFDSLGAALGRPLR